MDLKEKCSDDDADDKRQETFGPDTKMETPDQLKKLDSFSNVCFVFYSTISETGVMGRFGVT